MTTVPETTFPPTLPSLSQSARAARLRFARVLLILISFVSFGEAIFTYRSHIYEIDVILQRDAEEIENQGYRIDRDEFAQIRNRMRKVAHTNFVIFTGQSVLFLLCGLFISRAPAALPLLALILYIASWAIFCVMDPANLFQTIVIKLLVIPFLFRICLTGYAYSRAQHTMDPTNSKIAPGPPLGFAIILASYGIMLFSSVVTFLLITLQETYSYTIDDTALFLSSVSFSIVQVVITLLLISPVPQLPQHTISTRHRAWLLALPLIIICVIFSVLYNTLLNRYFEVPPQYLLGSIFAMNPAYVLTFYCLLPATYEEFFFRKGLLGYVAPLTNSHAAICLVAVAFGLSHLGQIFMIPYLILAGVLFGYLRYYSGSMTLPIIAHTIHNASIFLWHYYHTP